MNGLPQLFSHLQEPLALRACDGDPVGKFLPQDLVFDFEVPAERNARDTTSFAHVSGGTTGIFALRGNPRSCGIGR